MNKTVTINMGGMVFHIDENAYEVLKNYITTLKKHFSNSDGKDEIIADIEARIGEMFQAKVTDTRQVVVMADVEEAIKTMGKPEEFADEQGEKQAFAGKAEDYNYEGKKRLFRNPDDKVLGGVCSGISSYFDIDPIWLRLAFGLSFFVFGSGFLLYLVLWIALPKANTTAEKLQMRGEKVNVENIQKTIKDEIDGLKERYGTRSGKAATGAARAVDFFVEILKVFVKIIVKIAAVLAILIGLFVLCGLSISFTGANIFNSLPTSIIFPGIFESHSQQTLAIITAALIIGIPFFMLLYAGARLLFNIKMRSRVFNFVMLGLWSIGVVCSLFLVQRVSMNFTERQSIRQNIPIIQPVNNTLYIEVADTVNGPTSDNFNYNNGVWDLSSWNGKIFINNVDLNIVRSTTDKFELVQVQSASGRGFEDAFNNAKKITYGLQQKDSVLLLHDNFMLDKGDKFRKQRVKLVLKVPVGKSVVLGANTESIIYDIKNVTDTYDPEMAGHKWEMKEAGLTCLDCDDNDFDNYRHHGRRRHNKNDEDSDY